MRTALNRSEPLCSGSDWVQSGLEQFRAVQSSSERFREFREVYRVQSSSEQFRAVQSGSEQFRAVQSGSEQFRANDMRGCHGAKVLPGGGIGEEDTSPRPRGIVKTISVR